MEGEYRSSKDNDIGKISGRNKAMTDLSNLKLPSLNDTPAISSRRLSRLQQQILCFDAIFLLIYLVIFIIKAYLYIKEYTHLDHFKDNFLAIADISLMFGTVILFCILACDGCLRPCYLSMMLVYCLIASAFSIYTYLRFESFFGSSPHFEYLLISEIIEGCVLFTSGLFFGFVYIRYKQIEKESKYLMKMSGENSLFGYNNSIVDK